MVSRSLERRLSRIEERAAPATSPFLTFATPHDGGGYDVEEHYTLVPIGSGVRVERSRAPSLEGLSGTVIVDDVEE